MNLRTRLRERFNTDHGTDPTFIAYAPGRVNLIGDHTDYNDGFVMPLAIDRGVGMALTPRQDDQVRITSLDYQQSRSFKLGALSKGEHSWLEYPKGVAWALAERGHRLRGFDAVLGGDVPQGTGLSSSAALELCTARAFAAVSDLPWEPTEMALTGQRAENGWLGMSCGIMDQLISARGVEDHALVIDCRDLSCRPVPLPEAAQVVVLDTKTPRGLVDSAYNERRGQCDAGAERLGVDKLRDVPATELSGRVAALPEPSQRRVRHVVSENARVLEAAEAMAAGDAARLGQLMNASHASLRDDFQVSCEALDVMAEIAQTTEGCFGARMTGAGFGGACVALVAPAALDGFCDHVAARYKQTINRDPSIYPCRAVAGASITEEF